MKKSDLTYDSVKAVMLKLGHPFFTATMDPNFIGIRTKNVKADNFDDYFCCLWVDEKGEKQIWINDKFTTDPGKYYLQKKLLNPKGCGILVPGHYSKVWGLGKHLGKYEAFLQIGRKVKAYRDRNMDDVLDMDPATIDEGFHGCNMHHGYGAGKVGPNSAMCQVHSAEKDLNYLIEFFKKTIPFAGSRVSYSLITEADF